MNPRVRGLIVLAGIIVFSVVFCGLFPFFILPSLGVAVALPLIEVPGEVVSQNFLPGIPLTNTIIGTLVADAIAIGLAVLAWRASKGWTNEVPGRFQGLVESFIGVFYNFMKGVGGARLRTAPLLWPLVATIFIFLLAGNWMKLVPGVETVGKMHCSHAGQIGYPAVPGIAGTATLYVNGVFSAGTRQTAETEEACVDYFHGDWSRYEQESADAIASQVEQASVAVADAQLLLSELQASLPEGELSEAQQAELDSALAAVEKAEKELARQETRQEYAALIPGLERQVTQAEQALANADEEAIADAEEEVAAATDALNAAKTQVAFPGASLAFNAGELESGASPFLFHVTPFVRGPATDLSVAVTLALISIVSVQVYGVYSLGPAYFEKFINISALGNLGKKPLGAIDFIVGLIEIISEIGKIVSLAFRLFGNIFAGGVALIALTFLVAFIVPMVMYSLEIIIGAVQALVFAVLTLVFAAQAMESHHGDDHEHAEEH
jgi:F0F1-type ATP synthase membrane subunit a